MTDQIRAGLMDGLGFRFQVGDVVCHRGAVEPRPATWGDGKYRGSDSPEPALPF